VSPEARVAFAWEAFARGDALLAEGRAKEAWTAYTEGHDVVLDCPAMHLESHRRLRRANQAAGYWGEWLTDVALLLLAPFGVFELVAWREGRSGAAGCARGEVAG
jgi:hypothetical protein